MKLLECQRRRTRRRGGRGGGHEGLRRNGLREMEGYLEGKIFVGVWALMIIFWTFLNRQRLWWITVHRYVYTCVLNLKVGSGCILLTVHYCKVYCKVIAC